jgi:amino acid transporter
VRKKLTFLSLSLLIISAIDSNRNLPAAAVFGSPLIFYFLFGALVFLFPTALVSAEMASAHPDKEGIFHWVREAFGEKWGMLAIWLQWVNTVVWFPTILSFIAGSTAFLFDPTLIQSKPYMIGMISGIFWLLTLLNLRGVHVSARVNSWFVSIGTLFPMLFLIVLGGIWIGKGEERFLSFAPEAIFPQLASLDTWVALVAVICSYLGMELTSVHVLDVDRPQDTYPKALGLSSIVILGTMLFGALTIGIVLPPDKINLAGGIMQVFASFFGAFGLPALVPIMTLLIVVGSIGSMINWMISPSKGLLLAARHRFLPPYFTQLNRAGVASRVLVAQALIVTALCLLLLYVPSINAFYWLLTALSTGMYMLMYLLMFSAAWRLKKDHHPTQLQAKRRFFIPGGQKGLRIVSAVGIGGALLTYFLGYVPPGAIDVGSPAQYTALIFGGNVLFITPVLGALWYKKRCS